MKVLCGVRCVPTNTSQILQQVLTKTNILPVPVPFSPLSPLPPVRPRSPFSPSSPLGPRTPVSPLSPLSPVGPARPGAPLQRHEGPFIIYTMGYTIRSSYMIKNLTSHSLA